MKAARVLQFGPPTVITNDDLPKPVPGPGQLLVHVKGGFHLCGRLARPHSAAVVKQNAICESPFWSAVGKVRRSLFSFKQSLCERTALLCAA